MLPKTQACELYLSTGLATLLSATWTDTGCMSSTHSRLYKQIAISNLDRAKVRVLCSNQPTLQLRTTIRPCSTQTSHIDIQTRPTPGFDNFSLVIKVGLWFLSLRKHLTRSCIMLFLLRWHEQTPFNLRNFQKVLTWWPPASRGPTRGH